MWALFKDGVRVSKPHSTRIAAWTEALEAKVVSRAGADFPGDHEGFFLMDGYTIEEFEMTITADEYQTFAKGNVVTTPGDKLIKARDLLTQMHRCHPDELRTTQFQEIDMLLREVFTETRGAFFALGVAGEGGEIADKVKKGVRGDYDYANMGEDRRRALALEIGDNLWYLANLANELGFKLSEIMQMNVDKLLDRRARGASRGEGDDR